MKTPNSNDKCYLNLLSYLGDHYGSIHSLIKPYLGNKILEIGCGTGTHAKHFQDKRLVVGIDIDSSYIKKFNKAFSSFDYISGHTLDIINDKVVQKLSKYEFDTIFSSHVLEHIKEDNLAIENMHKILKRGGRLILIVPAHRFAYNQMDKSLGHHKRYNKNDMDALLSNAGFKIKKQFHHSALGIIGWYLFGFLKMDYVPLPLLKIFNKISPKTHLFENKIKLPFGLSLITIAKKD